jgi:hypothetical protein
VFDAFAEAAELGITPGAVRSEFSRLPRPCELE